MLQETVDIESCHLAPCARRPTFSCGILCGKKWAVCRFRKMQSLCLVLCLLFEPQFAENLLAMLEVEASLHGVDRQLGFLGRTVFMRPYRTVQYQKPSPADTGDACNPPGRLSASPNRDCRCSFWYTSAQAAKKKHSGRNVIEETVSREEQHKRIYLESFTKFSINFIVYDDRVCCRYQSRCDL
jgi:hypothetical protein